MSYRTRSLALCGILWGCAPGGPTDPAVRVTASGLPAGAAALTISATLGDAGIHRSLRYALAGQAQISFGLFLPEGATGKLTLALQALDAPGCVLSTGAGELPVDGVKDATLQVPMTALAAPECMRPPRIDGVTPPLVQTQGKALLTIRGADFRPGARVSIAGRDGTGVMVRSAQEIAVSAPALPGVLGAVKVKVTNPDGAAAERGDLLALYTDALSFSIKTYPVRADVDKALPPRSLDVGDLNGDGRPDVVTANSDGSLAVLLNQDGNSFKSSVYPLGGKNAFTVRIADLFGTGRPALLVTIQLDVAGDPKFALTILRNRGDGTFAVDHADDLPFPSGYGAYFNPFTIADVNRDGFVDLLVQDTNAIKVFLNRGDGTFDPLGGALYQTGDPIAMVVVDVNRDGFPDLATFGQGDVDVLVNGGDGSFPDSLHFSKVVTGIGTVSRCIAAGDVDGDGFPDLLIPDDIDKLNVLLNGGLNQAGGWTGLLTAMDKIRSYPTGKSPECALAGDLSGDGKPELLAADVNDSDVTLYVNQGDLKLTPLKPLGVGKNPVSLRIADMDGDGRPDVVVANYADSSVSILYNTSQ